VSGALLVATLVGFAGGFAWLFDLVANFRPQLAVLALAVLAVAVLRRRGAAALLAGFAVAANAAVMAPLVLPPPAVPAGGRRFTVAHLNMQWAAGSVEDFRALLGEGSPADVVVVLEPNEGWFDQLLRRGSPLQLHKARRDSQAFVASRLPVRDLDQPADPDLPLAAVEFTLDAPAAEVRVLALDLPSPWTPREAAFRDRGLAAVERWRRAQPGPVLVVGDLNATPWSAPFRRLMETAGLEDARQGRGPLPSWPEALGPLGLPIDQSLHTPDLGVAEVSRRSGFGSTHRSLFVTYAAFG
jgi:endonuclease/exonuclease/phosphatase (EEP) superfamily protein YafD